MSKTAAKPDMTVSTAYLAAALDLTPRRVHQLVEAGLPKLEPGKFNLTACFTWYIDYQVSTRAAEPESITAARRQLFQSQKKRIDLEIAEKEKTLIPLPAFEQCLMRTAAVYNEQLESLPGRLAPVLIGITRPAELERAIQQEVRNTREATAVAFAEAHALGESDAA